MKASIIAILCATLLSAAIITSHAQIYKTTDEKGNPKFSDSPDPKATESTLIDLKPVNILAPVATKTDATKPAEDQQTSFYKILAITSPDNEGIIPNGLAPTTVTTSLSPSLAAGHQLRLLVNGMQTTTGTATSFTIPRLNRGTNTLQLEVIEDDEVLQRSETISIFAYWPGGK